MDPGSSPCRFKTSILSCGFFLFPITAYLISVSIVLMLTTVFVRPITASNYQHFDLLASRYCQNIIPRISCSDKEMQTAIYINHWSRKHDYMYCFQDDCNKLQVFRARDRLCRFISTVYPFVLLATAYFGAQLYRFEPQVCKTCLCCWFCSMATNI